MINERPIVTLCPSATLEKVSSTLPQCVSKGTLITNSGDVRVVFDISNVNGSPAFPSSLVTQLNLKCSEGITANLVRRNPLKKLNKKFRCGFCGAAFTLKRVFNEHRKIHTSEKAHLCDTCGKAFLNKSDFNRHQRIHSGEKPYLCATCGQSFYDSGNLTRHQRTHTVSRLKCKTCGELFINNSDLEAHKTTHQGERPFVCSVCGKGFTKTSNLKSHILTHTGEKSYLCDICGKGFSLLGNFKVHQRKVHQLLHSDSQ